MRVAGTSTDLTASYKLVAIKLITASKEHLENHYSDLAGKPFFPGLVACKPATSSLSVSKDILR